MLVLPPSRGKKTDEESSWCYIASSRVKKVNQVVDVGIASSVKVNRK
jgi:hypothetical protein